MGLSLPVRWYRNDRGTEQTERSIVFSCNQFSGVLEPRYNVFRISSFNEILSILRNFGIEVVTVAPLCVIELKIRPEVTGLRPK